MLRDGRFLVIRSKPREEHAKTGRSTCQLARLEIVGRCHHDFIFGCMDVTSRRSRLNAF